MPDLTFSINGAETVAFAAAPMIAFRLQVSNSAVGERIHSVALRTQILIEVVAGNVFQPWRKRLRRSVGWRSRD